MKHILENNRICAIMRGVPLGKALEMCIRDRIRALSLSGWLLLIFSLLPAIIGMAAFTIATNTGAQAVLEKPDFAFTYIATVVLGPMLGLMFMISGLSATMSSGDSDALSGVTILLTEVYPRCG